MVVFRAVALNKAGGKLYPQPTPAGNICQCLEPFGGLPTGGVLLASLERDSIMLQCTGQPPPTNPPQWRISLPKMAAVQRLRNLALEGHWGPPYLPPFLPSPARWPPGILKLEVHMFVLCQTLLKCQYTLGFPWHFFIRVILFVHCLFSKGRFCKDRLNTGVQGVTLKGKSL